MTVLVLMAVLVLMTVLVLMAVLVLMTVLVGCGQLFIDKEEAVPLEGKKSGLWSHAYVIELRLQGEPREFIHVELLCRRVGDNKLPIVSGKGRQRPDG